MKILQMKVGKERQRHITKQLVHSFSVNIRISQSTVNITVLGLTNPNVNLKRMHRLYIDTQLNCPHEQVVLSAPKVKS